MTRMFDDPEARLRAEVASAAAGERRRIKAYIAREIRRASTKHDGVALRSMLVALRALLHELETGSDIRWDRDGRPE